MAELSMANQNMQGLSTSSTTVLFCDICSKPFTNEHTRARHEEYCGSRPRRRLRSCRACNAAKRKCSFEEPCSRCSKKGMNCIYEAVGSGKRALSPPQGDDRRRRARVPDTSDLVGAHSDVDTREGVVTDLCLLASAEPGAGEVQYTPDFAIDFASVVFGSERPSLDEYLALDGLLAFDDNVPTSDGETLHVPMAPYETLDGFGQTWCGWLRRGVALSAVTENRIVTRRPGQVDILHMEQPLAQHNADLVIQALRCFPAMMLRRETFPWYIHRQSYVLHKTTASELPKALSNCMGLAQSFALRTPDTRSFLWQNVRSEYLRLHSEMCHMSNYEVLAAVQACMIYLIMCIIDHSSEYQGNNSQELLLTLHVNFGACSPSDQAQKHQSTWENWIFSESRRRLNHLWFLVGCVVCVKTGNLYDSTHKYRTLDLPSPKSLWEATSQSAWEAECEATRPLQLSSLATLGDLIDAQQADYTPANANKLDQWNSGVDNLGSLLNLVGAML